MDLQEILAFGLVALAAIFAMRRFFRQLLSGDGSPKCAKCGLNQSVRKPVIEKVSQTHE